MNDKNQQNLSGEELLQQLMAQVDEDHEEGGSCCGCCGGQAD